jgi:hypothetical protein
LHGRIGWCPEGLGFSAVQLLLKGLAMTFATRLFPTFLSVAILAAVLAAPSRSHAQNADEQARLRARTSEQLVIDPIPTDPTRIQFELDVLEHQINDIDIAGITAVQWIGAALMVGGGVTFVIGALLAGVAALGDNDDGALEALGFYSAIGLPFVAVGGLMVGLAELDGGLQRRRELASRYQQLRLAQRGLYVQPAFFPVRGGGGVALQGTF